ncbi:EcsC family protein [Streptomyces sulfonofaciens]|nr:EcsC family protein [Streptomyces sulfonofaciens]
MPGPAAPPARRRMAAVRDGVRSSGRRARATVGFLTDRVIDIAPRIPVRDLATLRKQFPGLTPDEIADKLIAGAANGTSTVGAGIGAMAMLPVPPAMPTELAAEVTGVAAIELKLIAELHEVYGRRPPGGLKERSIAYLTSWSGERGIDVTKPWTVNSAVGTQMKRELRQQITKRLVRNLPNLMPLMVGAAVGAVMNRRDTRRLAERVRGDLRRHQVPWEDLPRLPPLEKPAGVLPPGALPGGSDTLPGGSGPLPGGPGTLPGGVEP